MTKKSTKKSKPAKASSKSPKPKATASKASGSSDVKAIIIAVISTILVCAVIVFVLLLCTGIIKFGDNATDNSNNSTSQSAGETSGPIDNPNKLAKMNGNLVSVGDLQFYLPYSFENGGKNSDGAYTFNLVNDEGWAQVLVYAERSSKDPAKYLMDLSDYLDITDSSYTINGTTWVQAENANALAYATKLDGVIYAIYYSVKLDSDATAKAMSMIPKTLYMKKIYQ